MFFEFPTNFDEMQINFDITAFSKTLFIFDSQIGKLSIPLSQSQLIDRKEWFTLKNHKEENCLMVLMSFADMREKKMIKELSNSICLENLNNSIMSNKSIENKMKISVIVNKPKYNYSTDYKPNFKNPNTNSNPSLDLARHNSINIDFKNEKCVLLSPPSQRNLNSTLNIIKTSKVDETGNLTTLDSILVDQNDWLGLEYNNLHNSQNETFIAGSKGEKITKSQQYSLMVEENEKIMRMKENLRINRDKLKCYENKLMKEKENLEQNIRAFKKRREFIEKKNTIFNENFQKLDNELEKIKLQKELMENNKNSFFCLNILLNSSNSNMIDFKMDNLVNKLISKNSCQCNKENKNNLENEKIKIEETNIQIKQNDLPIEKIIDNFVEKLTPSYSKVNESNLSPSLNNLNKLSSTKNGSQHQHRDSKSTMISIKNSSNSNESTLNQATLNLHLNLHQIQKKPTSTNSNANISIITSAVKISSCNSSNKREASLNKKKEVVITSTPMNKLTLINMNKTLNTCTTNTIHSIVTNNTLTNKDSKSNNFFSSQNSKFERRTSVNSSLKQRTISDEKSINCTNSIRTNKTFKKQNSIGVRITKIKENTLLISNTNNINVESGLNIVSSQPNVTNFKKTQPNFLSMKINKVVKTNNKSMSVQKSLKNVTKK